MLCLLFWRLPGGPDGAVKDITSGVWVAAYAPFMAGFALLLFAQTSGADRIVVYIATTVASDIGGYAAGVLFGKHPMAPAISPKKTWEGFAGSVVACVLVGAGTSHQLLGMAWWQGAVVGLAVVVTATMGDLAESMVKRDLGVKDMGRILPGHGGLMDRLDSVDPGRTGRLRPAHGLCGQLMAPAPGELTFIEPRRPKPPRHLADLTPDERRQAVVASGLPAFRAAQVGTHYFSRLVDDPADWTDVPAAARESLAEALTPTLMTSVRDLSCDDGLTRKTVWKLFDGTLVESVLMRYPKTANSAARTTMCVSSQAGCGMNCPFCATGQAGLTRNLSTGEIVEQVVAGARALARGEVPGGPGRVNNVVFMGMGEPMANYKAVVGTLRRLTGPQP